MRGGIKRETFVTPEQIALIRQSFVLVQPRMDELGRAFYARLFATRPELRSVFPADMADQTRALTAMLELIVKILDLHDKLVPLIHYLGERHRAIKIKPEHYKPFGEALLWSLESMLQKKFTPETRLAWQTAYDFMVENMV